jgi:CheY-like chemotaxis protein
VWAIARPRPAQSRATPGSVLEAFWPILSDLRKEPVSDLALLRAVRSEEALKHVPFILTTARSATEHILVAKRSGAKAHPAHVEPPPVSVQPSVDQVSREPSWWSYGS